MALALVALTGTGALAQKPLTLAKDIEATIKADVVTNYLWRGQKLGEVSIQPTLGLGYKGLSLSAWGSYGISNSDDTKELDLTLSYTTGGFNVLLNLMTYGRLLLEFIILFFIAYAVIRLIMRSRNSYYSTLRILGATKGNTDNILRVELILMMLIAYGVDIAFVVLVNKGILQKLLNRELPQITKLLYYLTPVDYAVLGAVLLFMSLLIANRYSRHIFTKSAMKAFREGA